MEERAIKHERLKLLNNKAVFTRLSSSLSFRYGATNWDANGWVEMTLLPTVHDRPMSDSEPQSWSPKPKGHFGDVSKTSSGKGVGEYR